MIANPPSRDDAAASMLSVKNVSKFYGDFQANKDISFDIKRGEIHALLGENGAGKSTLVKMLYGSLQPNSGSIVWNGEPVSIGSPSRAREIGIGMVFQHFSLFEALSVAENIALSMPANTSVSEVAAQSEALSEKYGLPINAEALVGDLSVGERQRVEIVRCLLQEPELMILDEPTSVLAPQEAENLFKTLELLRSEGRSILFISHRLEEVRAHCDSATILRFGEVIASCDPRKETASSLAAMMVGQTVDGIAHNTSIEPGDIALEINGLSTTKPTPFSVALKELSLTVRQGEILGIAGVAGNGQSELFEAISGETLASAPEVIRINGVSVGRSDINERRRTGAAFIPEERNGHAAIGAMPLSENVLLARHQSDRVAFRWGGALGFVWHEMLAHATKRISEVMDVRKSREDPLAASLSGGNLQKFVVGRELDRQPSLLVVNQPSWGVDAGAAQRIRQAIIDLANAGSAIVMLSQDLDEILEVSTSVAVLFEGTLSSAHPTSSISREEIGLLMMGLSNSDARHEADHAA